jgi:hypothetical protein
MQTKNYDTYIIILPDLRRRPKFDEIKISMEFSRPIGGKFSSGALSAPQLLKITDKVEIEVPRIDIIGQTLIDGSDVGETIFTISDKVTYYSNEPIELKNKVCKHESIAIEDLKETIFYKSCPKMVSVFIGEEEFLYTKVESLWLKLNITEPNLTIFYDDVIRYGMIRYLLSRLLYGNFNINYLLRKYYKNFLIDLGHSRFCGFVQFFNDPKYSNMYKYFK